MAFFRGARNRDNLFIGTTRADTFLFDPADLTERDVIIGGAGKAIDTLRFSAAGAIGVSALSGVSGIERIELAAGSNSVVLTDALVSTAEGARLTVVGGSGDDLVYAADLTGANALDFVSGGGTDFVLGGAGADTFAFDASALTAADRVIGGNGLDSLILSGSGTITADHLGGMRGVDSIVLGDGGFSITLSQSFFEASDLGSQIVLGGAGADVIDATALGSEGGFFAGYLALLGGVGDDVIRGSRIYGQDIDGGAGADTIEAGYANVVYDANDVSATVTGGFLYLLGAATIDLTRLDDQSLDDTNVVTGFFGVDATGSSQSVTIVGGAGQVLLGGSGRDVISGGTTIVGGAGADTLTGNANSTTFRLAAGDFARGEIIRGVSGGDFLEFSGSNDIRGGTIEGIEYLYIRQFDADATTIVRANASQLGEVRFMSGLRGQLDITMERGVELLPNLSNNFGATINVTGTSGRDVIASPFIFNVRAGGGNDTIAANGSIFGESGNDSVTVQLVGSKILDGGDGIDTLIVVDPNGEFGGQIFVDLSNNDNQLQSSIIVKNFENVDFSDALGFRGQGVSVMGSRADNIIVGSGANDTLFGGSGDDIIAGGLGLNTLSGGGGADTFRFLNGDKDDVLYFGLATAITDFRVGEDRLEFDRNEFSIDGRAFDSMIESDGTGSIAGADLVIYTGGALASVEQVFNFLATVEVGSREHGIFVAAKDVDNHTILFYSNTNHPGYFEQIVEIADLGRIGDPADVLTLDLFGFI